MAAGAGGEPTAYNGAGLTWTRSQTLRDSAINRSAGLLLLSAVTRERERDWKNTEHTHTHAVMLKEQSRDFTRLIYVQHIVSAEVLYK